MLGELVVVEIVYYNVVHHISLITSCRLPPASSKDVNSTLVLEREMALALKAFENLGLFRV
jgi:hypothetical protein